MGKLGESAAAVVEEHLFVCAYCRSRLKRIDEFVRACRVAMLRLKHEPEMYSERFYRLLRRL